MQSERVDAAIACIILDKSALVSLCLCTKDKYYKWIVNNTEIIIIFLCVLVFIICCLAGVFQGWVSAKYGNVSVGKG